MESQFRGGVPKEAKEDWMRQRAKENNHPKVISHVKEVFTLKQRENNTKKRGSHGTSTRT